MINMIGPIVPAYAAAEMPNVQFPWTLTICLKSCSIEVFQMTRNVDGTKVVAISYESEGFCAPVEGVLTEDEHQVISGCDAHDIINAAREYRIAKNSLVGVELYGAVGSAEELKNFFAKKCRDMHFKLAEEYNIAVDGIFVNRTGFQSFDCDQPLLNQGDMT